MLVNQPNWPIRLDNLNLPASVSDHRIIINCSANAAFLFQNSKARRPWKSVWTFKVSIR